MTTDTDERNRWNVADSVLRQCSAAVLTASSIIIEMAGIPDNAAVDVLDKLLAVKNLLDSARTQLYHARLKVPSE